MKNAAAKKPKPSPEQIRTLHNLAAEIKALEPWKKLWDRNFICIKKEEAETVFCSTMGKGGECFAVAMFEGDDAASGLMRLIESLSENPFGGLGFQDCVTLYWGDREDLEPEERGELKTLGIQYRGANNWVYFRRMIAECLPRPIYADEADFAVETLRQYIASCKYVNDLGREMEDGEAVLSEKRGGLWEYSTAKNFELPRMADQLILDENEKTSKKGKPLFETVRNMKSDGSEIELGVVYLPYSCGVNEEGEEVYTRMIMAVESESKIIIHSNMLEPDDDPSWETLNELIDVILNQKKKPAAVHVSDFAVASWLFDFCRRANIKLFRDGTPGLDEAVSYMANSGMMR